MFTKTERQNDGRTDDKNSMTETKAKQNNNEEKL